MRRRDLAAPFRGVRSPHPVDEVIDRCRAFATRMPRDTFFSCSTAATLLGIPLPHTLTPLTIHVSTPAPANATRTRGVVGHSVHVAEHDHRELDGLRVSTPARVWCELAHELAVVDLVVAGDWLVHWRQPLCSTAELALAVEQYPGRRGRRALRAALPLLSDRAESPQESRLRVILVTAGIRGFEVNHPITVRRRSFRADIAFPRKRLIIEYQGDYHRDREQWRRDVSRQSILATDDWFTMEVTAHDLRDSAELCARVRFLLAKRPTFT